MIVAERVDVCQTIEPNIRLPLVNNKLTAITDNKKNTRHMKEVNKRHRQRHFLSSFIFFRNNSERGTSKVKSASGLPPGYKTKQEQIR